MPLSWTISHPQRLVIALARGEVAPHEFGAYLEAMQPVGGYRRLFVVSGMSTVRPGADEERRPGGARPCRAREDEAAYASALGYAEAAQGIDRPIRIFREQHEARRWLGSFITAEQAEG